MIIYNIEIKTINFHVIINYYNAYLNNKFLLFLNRKLIFNIYLTKKNVYVLQMFIRLNIIILICLLSYSICNT